MVSGGELHGMMLTNSAELLQSAFGLVDCLDPFLCLVVSCFEGLFERGQPWVEGHNAWDISCLLFCGTLKLTCAIIWDSTRSSVIHERIARMLVRAIHL